MSQQGTKLLPTMINFHETHELMKSYLAKKRFSYVYEEAIKYYNKNNSFLTNQQVLMLVKLVFYVLKKKIMAKFVGRVKNSLPVQAVYEIYSVMTNVYLSWEGVLTMQMNTEDPVFFDMIHRHNRLKKSRESTIKTKRPQSLLFGSKKDMMVPKKINNEYNMEIFFKQCLRMVINSLTVMISCIDRSKIGQMMSCLKMGVSIMSRFEEHRFPIERAHFYILKCQIIEYLKEHDERVKIDLKYHFPTGLFQMIYRGFYSWKQAKTCHYVQLLFRMIIVSMKNEIISVEEAYVLGNQIKLLVFTMKGKESEMAERRISSKDRRGAVNLKTGLPPQPQKKLSSNSHQILKQTERQESSSQARWKAKYFNTLKTILVELESFISSRKELTHILRVYMKPIHCMYKQNPTHPNDELIDEIPVLLEAENKKNKSPTTTRQNQNIVTPLGYSRKEIEVTDVFRKEELQDEDHAHDGITGHTQLAKKKDNKIILQNIINIKHKKKLSLNQKKDSSSRDWKGFNKSQSTQANSTFQIPNKSHDPCKKKFPFTQLISNLVTTSFSELKALQPCLHEPMNLLQESQSDSDNELEYEFEMKRRTTIQELNNRFYKHSNPNYMEKEEKEQENEGKESWDGGDDEERNLEEVGFGKKKISEDLEFEEIRLLDDVIKEKIFGYLDLELVDVIKEKQDKSQQAASGDSKRPENAPMINCYSEVTRLTENLKSEVQELNRRRKMVIDKLKYKRYSTKRCQQYDESQKEYHSISSALKDLDNIYNTKNNLTQKAQKCVNLYRRLLRIDQLQHKSQNSIFDHTIKKYGNIYRKYKEELSMIGEQDEDEDQSQRRSEEIPVLQYIIKNRSVSLLQQTLKRRELQSKFECTAKKHILTEGKNQIALRDTFDNLRANISKTQFNQSNSLTKNFSLKIPEIQ